MKTFRAWIVTAICALAVSVALPAAAAASGDHAAEPPPPASEDAGKSTMDEMKKEAAGHEEEAGGHEEEAGGHEEAAGHGAGGVSDFADEMSEEEAEEVSMLARWPSRVLAQQVIALHRVSGDEHEAEARLHAALASKDKSLVDAHALRHAHVALDKGNIERGIKYLDAALSQPLGPDSGKALHVAGRELPSAQETQDIVATVGGSVLILIAGALLFGRRKKPAAGV